MDRGRHSHTATTGLLTAGIVGPVVFTAAFVGQALSRPDYSHITDPVSALAAGPTGWMQDVNFLVTGALMAAFAFGVHRAVTRSRWRSLASAALVVSGLGLMLAGIFPARDAAGAFATTPAHVAAAALSFLGAGTGLTLIGIALASGPGSRLLAGCTGLSGLVTVIAFLVTAATAIPSGAPLHPWLGLAQRLTLAAWFIGTVVLAVALMRAGARRRSAQPASTARPAGWELRSALLRGAPVIERRLSVQRVSTAVLEGGQGSPVVLLHGQGGSAALWLPIIPDLAAQHRVVAPDLPGLGSSRVEGEALGPAEIQTWLGAMIDRTCASPPTLVGLSLGGQVAARFAAHHSDRIARLVLVDTPGLTGRPRPRPATLFTLLRHNARPTMGSSLALLRQLTADLDQLRDAFGPRWEAFAHYLLDRARTPDVRRANQRLLRSIGLEAIPAGELASITAETTLVWGREDRVTPLSDAQRASETYGWPLHVIDDAGHLSVAEQPHAALRALRAGEGAWT